MFRNSWKNHITTSIISKMECYRYYSESGSLTQVQANQNNMNKIALVLLALGLLGDNLPYYTSTH